MKTVASLIALCALVLLSIPSGAFARGHGQVVTGSGFAFQSRPFFAQRSFFVERPFFAQRSFFVQRPFFVQQRPFFVQRPFFAQRVVVVERPFVARPFAGQPIIFARPIIVPRREVFIVGGSGFVVVR